MSIASFIFKFRFIEERDKPEFTKNRQSVCRFKILHFVGFLHNSQNSPSRNFFYVNTMKSSYFFNFWIDFTFLLTYNSLAYAKIRSCVLKLRGEQNVEYRTGGA